MTPTSEEVAQAILGHDDAALEAMIRHLESGGRGIDRVLDGLASHESADVRGWTVWFARRFPGPEKERLLTHLADDVNVDVRIDARRGLLDGDPARVRRLAPVYLKALNSADPIEATDAIWQLVRYRIPQALEPLRALDKRAVHPLVRNTARVGMLVLTGGEEQLLWGLSQHDHSSIELWIKGLLYLGSEGALAALEQLAVGGPDEECRRLAREALVVREAVRPLPQQ